MSARKHSSVPSAHQEGFEHADKRLPILILMVLVFLAMIGAAGVSVLMLIQESGERDRLGSLAQSYAQHLVRKGGDLPPERALALMHPLEQEGDERFEIVFRRSDGLFAGPSHARLDPNADFTKSLEQLDDKTNPNTWIGPRAADKLSVIAAYEEKRSQFILVVYRDMSDLRASFWPVAGVVVAVILSTAMFLIVLFWGERGTLLRETREIRQRFQKYYDVGLVGIADTSLETGWLRFNDRLCEILGYSPAELRRTNWVELTHPDDLEEELQEFRRALHGEIAGYTREKRFIRKNGQTFHAMTSLRCVWGDDGKVNYFITFLFDITDRKKAEEALKKSQRGLARAQELAHLGSWDWDIPANSITWSDETYRIFSLKPQEFNATYEAFLLAVHPEDRQLERSAMSRVLADPRANYNMEYRVVRPDGMVRHVHLLGEIIRNQEGIPLRMEGFIQDITDYKRIESRLRALNDKLEQRVMERTLALEKANNALRGEIIERKSAEEKLRALFDNSPDLILTVDRTQEIQFLNRKQQEMFPKMVIGQPLGNVLPADMFQQCQRCLKRVFQTNTASSLQVVCENDSWWEIRMAPISRECQPHSVMMVLTNITEKRTLQVQAIRNARLASLGILAASVAHEINNPNNAIGFSASSLAHFWREIAPILNDFQQHQSGFELGGMPLNEAIATLPRLIDGIGRNVQRIKKTVDVLKHMGRQDEGKIEEELDIQEILRSSVSILHAQIGKHTNHFSLNCTTQPVTVRGNSLQLEQVFINLIQNALQALPSRECKVSVDVYHRPDQEIVQISVSDQGHGIPKPFLDRITTPFFTTKGKSGGLGLGLSITDTIVKDHKGRLFFKSEPGGGTVATVELPVGGPVETTGI